MTTPADHCEHLDILYEPADRDVGLSEWAECQHCGADGPSILEIWHSQDGRWA